MTAKEMFELAKAGYKPTEIAEMHKLMKEADPETEPKAEPETEPKAEPETEPKAEPKAEPKVEPETDYKKLYEESQQNLAAAQKANLQKDMSGAKEDEQTILAKAIRGFM